MARVSKVAVAVATEPKAAPIAGFFADAALTFQSAPDARGVLDRLCRLGVGVGVTWAYARSDRQQAFAHRREDLEPSVDARVRTSAALSDVLARARHELAVVWSDDADGLEPFAAVPLVAAGRALGALAVSIEGSTELAMPVVQELACRAALALEALLRSPSLERSRDARSRTRAVEAVARRFADLLDGDVVVHVSSDDGEWLVPAAVHARRRERAQPLRRVFGVESLSSRDPVFARAFADRRPFSLRASQGPPAELLPGVHDPTLAIHASASGMVVPLWRGEGCVASVTMFRAAGERPFDRHDLSLAARVAPREASLLSSAMDASAAEEPTLRSGVVPALAALAEALSVEQVADLLVERVASVVGASGSSVVRSDPEPVALAASGALRDLIEGVRVDEVDPVARALRGAAVVLQRPDTIRAHYPWLAARPGVHALVAVPLMGTGSGVVVGAWVLAFPGAPPGSGPRRAAFDDLAATAGRALDRALRYAEEQVAKEVLGVIADACAVLASSVEWDRTLSNVVRVLVPTFGDGCAVDLVERGHVRRACVHPEATSAEASADVETITLPLSIGEIPLGSVTITRARRRGAASRVERLALHEVVRRCALAIDAARVRRDLAAAVAARDEFISIAGHELRTPLTTLRMHLWASQQFGEASPTAAGVDAAQVGRLERLVDQLLDASRISAGGLTLHVEPVELAELVDAAVAPFRGGSTPITFRGVAVHGVWDPFRITQVVTNLVHNAVRYGEGRPIDVRVEPAGDRAHVRVRDHGIGIEPEALGRIFERFERAVSSRNYGGLGLGLWIARSIVEAHGGSIAVESTKGRGSEFLVELPCVGPAPASAAKGGVS